MRRNRPSEAPGLRAKLARGSAGFGAGPNKRDFSCFGGAGTWKIRKCIDTCIACRLAARIERHV